jgi:hypothetical protein
MKFTRFLVVAAAAAPLLAGCSGSSKPSGPGATSTLSAQQAASLAHRLAQCIRDHGVPNFPDLVQTQGGGWDVPSGTPTPPAAAQQACKALSEQLPGGSSGNGPAPKPNKVTTAQMEAWRKWSACVRQQGISDWPDPNPDGTFTLPSRLSSDNTIAQKVFGLTACTRLRPQGLGLRFGTTTRDGG